MLKNIPNILTISRLFFSFILLLLLINSQILTPLALNIAALAIFLVASLTDFLDGYIARKYNIVSDFGKIFDPLADKLLILGAFLGLIVLERADVLAIFLILSREFFITGLRVYAASKKVDVSASFAGKLKTVAQIVAISFLLAGFITFGNILLWIATLMTLYSGYEYAKAYLKA